MTTEQLQDAFSGKIYHIAYQETVALAKAVAIHADGIYPDDLIEERRPNESEAVRDYRRKIWKPITKPYVNKIFTSLNKIRRSTEWSVAFDASKNSPRIVEGETLEDYLMVNFPKFESITNWAFSLLLKRYLIDTNSYVVVLPMSEEYNENEYVQPYPYLFRSEQVITINDSEVVVKSDEQSVYYEKGKAFFGERYYVITPEYIQRWDQKSIDRKFSLEYEYNHNIGFAPAFKLRGVVKDSVGDILINESRLAPMLPELDEAAREYSDLQAEIVQHVYNEKWEMADEDGECKKCRGKKTVQSIGLGSRSSGCDHCGGTGIEPRGPFTTLFIKAPMAGAEMTPTPPMGYLQKNTNIVEFQGKNVDKHIFKALAAVNMEFLAERPLSESGIAKAYDADETNNFVHGVAEDIVATIDRVAFFCNEFRYCLVVPDYYTRREMLPVINVPEVFDLFSSTVKEQQLASARTSKLNPAIINALEVDYAHKMFSANPDVGTRVALIIKLDPLSGVSEEDKMVMKSNKGITEETYIVSCSIGAFIDQAYDEMGNEFFDKQTKEQKEIIHNYAKEQIEASGVGGAIINDMFSESPVSNALKESVGGLTGMIEIAKAVASGLYDLEAAVALVSDRFGITEEEARKQLGTPQIAQSEVEKVVQLT